MKRTRPEAALARLMLTGLLWLGTGAGAHEIRPAIIDLNLAADGRYELVMQLNLEAMMAGIGPRHSDTDTAPQAREYNRLRALEPPRLEARLIDFLPEMRRGFTLRADGGALAPEFRGARIPDVGDLDLARDSQVRFGGELPAGTEVVTWQWSESFGANALRVNGPEGEDLYTAYLQDGQPSDPIEVSAAVRPAFGLRLMLLWLGGGLLLIGLAIVLAVRHQRRRTP